jgi:1L-myo-inositol 1-phosphate cytidylyltransferase
MIRHAVILAAGYGSRLARSADDIPKPLRRVAGQPLLRRNLLMLQAAGIEHVVIVVGYQGDLIRESVQSDPALQNLHIDFAFNPAFDRSNGISVLAARPFIPSPSPFLLQMADHIFEVAIARQMAALTVPTDGAILGIDRKINEVFDLDDATKVLTHDDRIASIGKTIPHYNAIDVGMFSCSHGLFDALRDARARSSRDDCSLSEGIAVLSQRGTMFTHDIGAAFWQDVDDNLMLNHVEALLNARDANHVPSHADHLPAFAV